MIDILRQLLHGEIHLHYDRFTFVNRNGSPRRLANHLLRGIDGRLRRARPWSLPLGLQLEATARCQLACPQCPRTMAVDGPGEGDMDWDDYQRLMAEIGPCLVAVAFWQWGEPLVHPRIADMVRLAHDYGCLTLLSTNGQVGAEYPLEPLFAAGLDLLIVSLDGTTQEVYRQFREDGEVETVKSFAAHAVATKRRLGLGTPLINLRTVATRDNEEQIPAIRQFAREVGADAYSVKSVSLYYDASPENPTLPRQRELRSYQYQGATEAAAYLAAGNTCRKPWYWPALRHDGRLLLCECDHRGEEVLGNVFTAGSFRRVWQSPTAAHVRRRFHPDGRIEVGFCQRCRYKRDDAIRRLDRFDTAGPGR